MKKEILPEVIPDKKPVIDPEKELIPDKWPDEAPLPEPKA